MSQGGMFSTVKTFILIGAYFAAFKLGNMSERPKAQWPKAKAGQNPYIAGDWAAWQKIYMAIVAVAILITLTGAGGGMMGMMGGGGYGGGYGY